MSDSYEFIPSTSNAFVARYVRWRELASDAPLEYGETLAVAALAGIAGARLRLTIDQIDYPVSASLYVALLGPSTISRKSNSLQSLGALLADVVPSLLMRQPGSPEGLVEDLGRHEATGGVLILDELASWFQGMKTRAHLKDMPGYLMRAYDGGMIAHRNKSKLVKGERVEDEVVVRHPVLSVVSGATPERLAMVSNRSDAEDGWWPRWVVCWPEGRPPLRALGARKDSALPAAREALVESLRWFNQRLGTGVAAVLAEDAWRAAAEWVGQIEQRIADDPENSAIYSRADLRIFKVAMLLALANETTERGPIMVQVNDIQDAGRLVLRWLDDSYRLMCMLGLNDFENDLERCLSYLTRRGGSMRRRDLARAMKLASKRLEEIENSLIERGQVERMELDNVAFWVLTEVAPADAAVQEATRLTRRADIMSRRMDD